MLIAGRGQRAYFLRWLYAAVLLVQLAPRILASVLYEAQRPGSYTLGQYLGFFDSFTAQHFAYLLVLTPALAAGAITDDKIRGSLDHLLTTCLHPAEIVLGKLLARVCQIMVLTLVALPIVCFFGVVGDLDVGFVAMLFAASAVLVIATTAVSLLASVWCQRTRDAVLCTYLALLAGFSLAWGAGAAGWHGLGQVLSPWHTIARADDGRPVAARLVPFAAAWLVAALAGVALASWRLRPAYAKMRSGTRVGWIRWRLRPMGANVNPVAWRERCLHGIRAAGSPAPSPVWLAVPLCALGSAAALLGLVLMRLSGRVDLLTAFQQEGLAGLHVAFRLNGVEGWEVAGPHGGIALFVLTLLLAVRASGSITDERERATWDALLLTPLSTAEIVRGKFWGLLTAGLPYVVAYAVPTLPLAILIGPEAFVACCAAVGAMVVVGPFVIAVGLYCSARLSSEQRSLLATLAACYGYLILASQLLLAGCAVYCIARAGLLVIERMLQNVLPGADVLVSGLAVTVAMLLLNAVITMPFAYVLLQWAERRVERTERAHVSGIEQEQQELLLKLNRLAETLADEDDRRDLTGH